MHERNVKKNFTKKKNGAEIFNTVTYRLLERNCIILPKHVIIMTQFSDQFKNQTKQFFYLILTSVNVLKFFGMSPKFVGRYYILLFLTIDEKCLFYIQIFYSQSKF